MQLTQVRFNIFLCNRNFHGSQGNPLGRISHLVACHFTSYLGLFFARNNLLTMVAVLHGLMQIQGIQTAN